MFKTALLVSILGFQVQAHDSKIYDECKEAYLKSEKYMSLEDKATTKEEKRKYGTLAKVAILEFRQCQSKHGGN